MTKLLNDLEYYVHVSFADDPTNEFAESYECDQVQVVSTLMGLKGLYVLDYLDDSLTIDYMDDDQIVTVTTPDEVAYQELKEFSELTFPKKTNKVVSLNTFRANNRR